MKRPKSGGKGVGFACTACDRRHPKWAGRCEGCGSWGTVEEVLPELEGRPLAPGVAPGEEARPIPVTEVESGGEGVRLRTGIGEVDRVLGGGLVGGSLVLLGGEPGIGKSTLLLRLAGGLAAQGKRVLYVCGEESPRQIRLRADRIGAVESRVLLFPEIEVERIAAAVRESPPDLLVVDSVQTLHSTEAPGVPGSPAQLAAVASRLLGLVKALSVPCVLVAHVNKEGELAGPKLLEHMVDAVLQFDGDRDQGLRFLRGVKNRFGGTGELGVFSMEEGGLVEVENPSALFHSEAHQDLPGSCVAAGVEGSRCYLVEVQALVAPSALAYPRRTAQGWEPARLAVLASVLERRLGMPLSREDVCVKLVGGIQLREPAMDLSLAVAIASSHRDRPVPPRTAFAGEVGLGGELRSVSFVERRVKEAERLGFARMVLPAGSVPRAKSGIEVLSAGTLAEVVARLLG